MTTLARDGVDEASRKRVRFPAGLDIKARRGDEIAVSILAEIVQARRVLGDASWEAAEAPAAEPPPEPETAIDPVCHMTVRVEGAMHTLEHDGKTYYFCCGGCRSRFAAEPEKYLAAS